MTKIYHSEELGEKFLEELKDNLKESFADCKTIAIKIHFGEPGNKSAFVPEQIKPITDILKSLNIDFFFYDSSVAYGSPRNDPESHKKMAIEKGWDKLGKIKTDDNFIDIKGENMTYQVCKSLADADGVLTISHFKGHYCSGFGGVIKNLGMGAVTKKTKGDIHEGGMPELKCKCTQCKACEMSCPIGGIKVTDKPEIKLCYGCSNCIYVCPAKVLKPKVNDFDILLGEAAAVAQKQFKKKFYISYLINISKHCDCESEPKEKIAKDCGYLFGKDGVAIDKAGYDLIIKNEGRNVFKEKNLKDGVEQIDAAEKFGMGSRKYDLVEIK